MRRRRGFIFTIDALLSIVLTLIVVSSIIEAEVNSNVYTVTTRAQNMQTAEGVLTILRTTPLQDLVNQSVIELWESTGVLNTTLVSPSMSPLAIVSTYWATGPVYNQVQEFRHDADVILGYILNSTLKGYYYQLMLNNYTSPYLSKLGANASNAKEISAATLILSGYKYNQTPRGYMARAYLTKIGSKNNTYIIRGDYIEAYTQSSSDAVDIKYIVPASAVPAGSNVSKITWFLEPAYVGSQYYVYLNGNLIWSGIVRYNKKLTSTTVPALLNYFKPGETNVFEVKVYNSGYGGGEDGAQYIEIQYTTSQARTFTFPTKFYLEDIKANYGLTVWRYFFIPGDLNSLNIKIAVANVTPTTPVNLSFMFNVSVPITGATCFYNSTTKVKTCSWNNATISAALKAAGYDYKMLSSKYAMAVFIVGNSYTMYPGIHILHNESYIQASYVPPVLVTQYSVDVTQPITLPRVGFTRNVTINFNVPSGVIPLWVKFQFPWLYYINYGQPYQYIEINNPAITPVYIYKHPPNPFIHALSRIGYSKDTYDYEYNLVENAISSGENTISVSLGRGYYIEPENGEGSLTYLIQGYAGYGNVFPRFIRAGCTGYNLTYWYSTGSVASSSTVLVGNPPSYCKVTTYDLLTGRSTYAVDDAIIRLFNNLGGNGTRTSPILIKLPANVQIEFASMGNIPGLTKPITITLRIWRNEG